MNNRPNLELARMFGTGHVYMDKLAGCPSLLSRIVASEQPEPKLEKRASLPWDGNLSRMRESASVAEQVGAELAKQAGLVTGVREFATGAVKLPFQAAGYGAKSFWRNTSPATKLKTGLIGSGIGLGALGVGAGVVGSHAIGKADELFSRPYGIEHIAHVMGQEELEKQALGFSEISGAISGVKNVLPGVLRKSKDVAKSGIRSVVSAPGKVMSAGANWLKPGNAAARNATKVESYSNKLLNKPAIAKPTGPSAAEQYYYERNLGRDLAAKQRSAQKVEQFAQRFGIEPNNPTQVTPINMDRDLRRAAAEQRLERMKAKGVRPGVGQVQSPTGQLNTATQPASTAGVVAPPTNGAPTQPAAASVEQAQKGQQAVAKSEAQGAASVQTPQEAEAKKRGRIWPWVGGAIGLGVAGAGIGASMLASRGADALNHEGQLPNTYTGYGAPIAGSASPYGYVTGPGVG